MDFSSKSEEIPYFRPKLQWVMETCNRNTCWDVVLHFAVFENYKRLLEGEDLTHTETSAKHAPGASVTPHGEFRFARYISSRARGQEQ